VKVNASMFTVGVASG